MKKRKQIDNSFGSIRMKHLYPAYWRYLEDRQGTYVKEQLRMKSYLLEHLYKILTEEGRAII